MKIQNSWNSWTNLLTKTKDIHLYSSYLFIYICTSMHVMYIHLSNYNYNYRHKLEIIQYIIQRNKQKRKGKLLGINLLFWQISFLKIWPYKREEKKRFWREGKPFFKKASQKLVTICIKQKVLPRTTHYCFTSVKLLL